jgi:hypothetical protein
MGSERATIRDRWAALPPANRRWILINALGVSALINVVANGVIAWASVRGQPIHLWSLPLIGKPSTVVDTIGTLFFLPAITTLGCTTAVWGELRSGRLPSVSLDGRLAQLPPTRLRRGALLGAATVALLAPPAVVVLVATDFQGITTGAFVLYKVVLGLVLGAAVTPLIALCAMADTVVAAPA